MDNVWEILMYIFFFILVLVGAYYSTRWISTRSMSLYKGKHINIIERIPVDRDKSFILLKKGEKVYLIGVTNGNMVVIDNFESNEIQEKEPGADERFLRPATSVITKCINISNRFLSNVSKLVKRTLSKDATSRSNKMSMAVEDKEFEDVLNKVYMRKQHLKERGELLKRGGKE